MIHKSLFGQLGDLFPHDRNGNVPVHNDHWQEMEFEHPKWIHMKLAFQLKNSRGELSI